MALASPVREDPYPSRVAARPRLTDRLDPVVYPGGPVTQRLSESEVESYAAQGYLFAERLFRPDEIAALNRELERLVRSDAIRDREETVIEPGSRAVRSVFQVHQLSREFERLACDPRVLNVARQLLGSEVYIHQSRANLKPGFTGKEFYWHSDFETWHVEDGMPRMRALSVSIALTPNAAFNGATHADTGLAHDLRRLRRPDARGSLQRVAQKAGSTACLPPNSSLGWPTGAVSSLPSDLPARRCSSTATPCTAQTRTSPPTPVATSSSSITASPTPLRNPSAASSRVLNTSRHVPTSFR